MGSMVRMGERVINDNQFNANDNKFNANQIYVNGMRGRKMEEMFFEILRVAVG